ncbi:MAG: lipopolysaccharide biosynthesis protein RfbH [Hungatella sp.]|nr:lipopolysaccharide biosynthesis protein RfbH [Hungatella sp.]MCI9501756.1 lipopolysaccharide biosynthesis protein RfbH [Hungatella sp.]
MFENKTESQARQEILELVGEYCDRFHQKKVFEEGDRIPYASRVYDRHEMMNLVDSSLEFWLTSGRYTEEFEKKLAEYLDIRYCSLVNSGSSANLVAFMALTSPLLGERQIRRGDEVITVAAGFPTTVTPMIQYGAVPVFVDVTIPQYNIDTDMLEQAYSDKTKAVMLAHTLGNPFDLEKVKAFCDRHNLWLVEDNCDALGTTYTLDGRERFSGTIGDIGTSSFYPPHHMTMGEGGAVYTDNPLLHKIIRSFRDWGRDCVCPSGRDNLCGHRFDRQYGELPLGYDHKYVYSHFGYNLKATDMQAAVGCAQLEKFPSFVERRRHNFERLYRGLLETEERLILPKAADNSKPSWFGFLITCREGVDRNQLVRYIESKGVQTRMLFAGNLTKHPCFDQMRESGQGYRIGGSLKNTDRIMRDTFWVGVYPGMTDHMIDYMAKIIREGSALAAEGGACGERL